MVCNDYQENEPATRVLKRNCVREREREKEGSDWWFYKEWLPRVSRGFLNELIESATCNRIFT